MRRARRCTTCRVLSATRLLSSTSRKPGRSSSWENGEQPRQARPPCAAVVALELEQRLLLRAAPLVGGAQVVDGELGQADPQARRVRQVARRVRAQPLGGPRVAGQLRAVLAVGVDEQQAVAALGLQHAADEHLHEVRLAHAGGGEDADVGGQRAAGDADARSRPRSRRCAGGRRAGRPSSCAGTRSRRARARRPCENCVGSDFGLRNSCAASGGVR